MRAASTTTYANALAGLVWLARSASAPLRFPPELIAKIQQMPRYKRPVGPDQLAASGMQIFGERRWLQMQKAKEMRRWR